MKGWPRKDANYFLIEFVLMVLFLMMNAADQRLQVVSPENYSTAGSFPISNFTTSRLVSALVITSVLRGGYIFWECYFLKLFILFKAPSYHSCFSECLLRKIKPQGQFENWKQ